MTAFCSILMARFGEQVNTPSSLNSYAAMITVALPKVDGCKGCLLAYKKTKARGGEYKNVNKAALFNNQSHANILCGTVCVIYCTFF